jgi:hypothetical protein
VINSEYLGGRVERLEKQNWWMRTAVIAALALAALPWALGAKKEELEKDPTLRGQRIVLLDAAGKLRVFIGADEDRDGRIGIYLYDQLGQRSAAMYVNNQQSGLSLYGQNNTERASLQLDGQGDLGLRFYDQEKSEHLGLSVTGPGNMTTISLGDSDTGSHARLRTGEDGSYFLLRNATDDARIQLMPSRSDPGIKVDASAGLPGVVVLDPQGEVTGRLP